MPTKKQQTQMSIRVLAAQNEKGIREGFQQAVENSQGAIILRDLRDAIAQGDVFGAEQATRPDRFESELTSATNGQAAAFTAGADRAHKELPKTLQKLGRTIDLLDPIALGVLNEEGARLVTNVTDQNRLAIVDVLEDVINRGVPPVRASKQIRSIVGVNRVQAGALIKQREAMEAAGQPQSIIDKTIARRTKKMIATRARTIARTESIRSVAQGRQRMWDQLTEDGVLDPGTMKQWVTAGDSRVGTDHISAVQHGEMNRQTVPVNQPFFIPETGQNVMTPNESRPNCRCTAILIFT